MWKNQREINAERFATIETKLLQITTDLNSLKNVKSSDNSEGISNLNVRIADLEVKMSKLWGLLVSQSELTKEDKLSKSGKRFSKLF